MKHEDITKQADMPIADDEELSHLEVVALEPKLAKRLLVFVQDAKHTRLMRLSGITPPQVVIRCRGCHKNLFGAHDIEGALESIAMFSQTPNGDHTDCRAKALAEMEAAR